MLNFRIVVSTALLWCLGVAAAVQVSKMTLTLKPLSEYYGVPESSVGVLISAIGLLAVALGAVVTALPALLGITRTLFSCCILAIGCSMLQYTLPSFGLMLAARIVEGLSHLGIVIVAPTLMSLIVTKKMRGLVMLLWGTFYGVAFALTSWLGAPLLERYGQSSIFLTHACFTAVVTLALFAYLPRKTDAPYGAQPSTNIEGAICLRFESIRFRQSIQWYCRQHTSTYVPANIRTPAVGWFFYTPTFVSIIAVLSSYATSENLLIVGFLPLASVFTSVFVVAVLVTKLPAIRISKIGFCMAAALCCLLILQSENMLLLAALFGVLGIIQGASYASIPQLNYAPTNQILAHGAMTQLGNLGNLVGVPLLILIESYWGIQGLFLAVATCYGIAAILLGRSQIKIPDERFKEA
ncbi:MAG: MFS transporter [Aliiglaciecola sp.]|uniref:MFS transporter n=1 Tax=Aliiglaciecola sp. TaxID=1872441 RepID=UPI0032987F4F